MNEGRLTWARDRYVNDPQEDRRWHLRWGDANRAACGTGLDESVETHEPGEWLPLERCIGCGMAVRRQLGI